VVARTSTPRSRVSNLTDEDIVRHLGAVGWNPTDFARFARLGHTSGKANGKNPVLVELALEYVEKLPLELLSRPEMQTPVRQAPGRRMAMAHRAAQARHAEEQKVFSRG
jgi:hypothetical protein